MCWEKFGWTSQKADELLLPVLKEYNKHEVRDFAFIDLLPVLTEYVCYFYCIGKFSSCLLSTFFLILPSYYEYLDIEYFNVDSTAVGSILQFQ